MRHIKKSLAVLIIALTTLAFTNVLASCSSSNDSRFNKAIEQLNTMLPMNLGNGFTMEKVTSDGDAIVYNIKCDENDIDMEMMEQSKDELRTNSLAQLKSQKRADKNFASLLKYCQDNGKNIVYRYVGTPSGKTVDIIIESDEI